MTEINYLKGDATQPHSQGTKIIVHVCNDLGGWGKGFVLAISKAPGGAAAGCEKSPRSDRHAQTTQTPRHGVRDVLAEVADEQQGQLVHMIARLQDVADARR